VISGHVTMPYEQGTNTRIHTIFSAESTV
jgi:hypothetical protein